MRRLREAADRLVGEWGQKLAELPVQLIEEPEFRLAGAEEAIRQVVASIEQILQHHEPLAARPDGQGRRGPRPLAGRSPARRSGGRRPPLAAADVLELLRYYPKWRFQSLVLQQASPALPEPARPPVRRAARDQLLPRAA